MTQDITDIVAEFTPLLLGSFVAPLAIFGLGVISYHLAQKYELSIRIQSTSKHILNKVDNISDELVKFVGENYSLISPKYK